MEILEIMTFTKAVDGSTKVLGTYLYVEGSQMLRDRKKNTGKSVCFWA